MLPVSMNLTRATSTVRARGCSASASPSAASSCLTTDQSRSPASDEADIATAAIEGVGERRLAHGRLRGLGACQWTRPNAPVRTRSTRVDNTNTVCDQAAW